jgi:hypothetical protein
MFSVLVGKKILALRGFPEQRFGKEIVPLNFMLFDDEETFIEFTPQDKYDYHDCSELARHVEVRKNKKKWKELLDCEGTIKETDADYSF